MEAIVRAAFPTFDYRALYRAKVISQSSDKKKVDVKPLDSDFPGVTAELALFGAKVTVDVAANTHCLLTWDGGDPRKPIALLFFAAAGTKEVARKGDAVGCGYLSGTAPTGGGPVTFTLAPESPAPPVPIPNSVHLVGEITAGSSQIKID